MRFTSAFVAGLVAIASAQETTATAEPTTTVAAATTAPLTPEQSRVAACLDACNDGDVNCEAKCVNVPFPNEDQVSANQDCVADCPKGNGTEADIQAYENCVLGCIGNFYHPTNAGANAPAGTGGSGDSDSNGGSDSGSNGDSGSGDSGDSGDSSSGSNNDGDDGNGDSSSSTNGNGAAAMGLSTTAFGLAAFLAAFAAL